MAAYDLEEQEQLAELKAFWEKWGNKISTGALVLAIAALAWFGWQRYQQSQGSSASAVYAELLSAAAAGDVAKLGQLTNSLTKDYGSHLQASLGALVAASVDADKGDAKGARAKLQWVVDNSKDALVKDVARLRLAAVMLDEKAYDEALRVLDGDSSTEFAARVAEMRGDVLLEQGKRDLARDAYKKAQASLSGDNGLKSVLDAKLEALGDK